MSLEGNSASLQNDYLKVRVFLYKYTPPFTRIAGQENGNFGPSLNQNVTQPGAPSTTENSCLYEQNLKVARFNCPFDPSYFSRFELTPYLSNYKVTQSMKDMENSLSIEFLNDVVAMSSLQPPSPVTASTTSAFVQAANAYKVAYNGGNPPQSVRRPTFFPNANINAAKPDSIANYSLNPRDPKKFVSPTPLSADDLVTNIAQYYTETATEFELDALRVELAMRLRGVQDPTRLAALQQIFAQLSYQNPSSITTQEIRQNFQQANAPDTGIGNNLGADGLLISDLIQKFDMISVVVYKWPFPSNLVEQYLLNTQPNLFDTEPMMFACPTALLPLSQIPSASIGGTTTIPLYESEFLGFVNDISYTSTPGTAAPTVSINARGVASLLDSSKRIYGATVYQQGIFDMGELPNVGGSASQSLLFQNVLQSFKKDNAGSSRTTSPIDMLKILLREFYHIKFLTSTIDSSTANAQALPLITVRPTTCYIDIREIEYNNNVIGATSVTTSIPDNAADSNIALAAGNPSRGSTNFLSIPTYLYSLVMQMRKFNVQVTGESTPRLYGFQADAVGDTPLEINENFFATEAFTPYFVRLSDAFGNYNPSLKTPKDIIAEINAMAYTEFFETPGGRLVFRTPQYNNTTSISTGTSSDPNQNALMSDTTQVVPISFNYTDTKDHLLSGYQMSMSLQIMPDPIPLLFPRYVNGKVLSQYGFLQEAPLSNPNAQPRNQTQQPPGELEGTFQFCRFFYEFNNSLLKNGVVNYVGSNQVEIGQTFFDITNQKFGYVTTVSKQAQVGGTYVASASLSMVRNAMPTFGSEPVGTNTTIAPEVYALPTLESVVNAYNATSNKILTDATPLRSSLGAIVNRDLGYAQLSVLNKSTSSSGNALVGNTSNA